MSYRKQTALLSLDYPVGNQNMLKIKKWKSIGIVAVIFSLTFFADPSAVQASAMISANVITLINQSRAAEGLSTLATNAKLNLAAQNKANDMFAQQYFEHIGPDGRDMTDWVEEQGYNWYAIGENIAYGYDTAESVHTAFMNSSGHRANILEADYKDVGVAAVSGNFEGDTTIMVVEEFGATDTVEQTTYSLTVNDGLGGGSYASGTSVMINASVPATGKVFDKWTGDATYLASTTSSTTTVTMPAKAITLTATYKTAIIYPNGTLIKTATSPKVYVIIDNKKKWISTPEVFEQLGYKWTNVAIITEADLDKYPDFEDDLIRAINGYQVFLVVSGIKRHIPNPEVFLDYGFSWNDVKDVSQATIDKYKDICLIRASKTTDVYYLTNGIKKLIPTAAIFNSYNDNKWTDIQIISPNEMNSYPTADLINLTNSNEVYLVEGTTKRKIPSIAVFNKYRYNWNYVVIVNQTELNYYKVGAEVK